MGVHYFRPRRPTFIVLDLLPERVWQHQVVRPRYDAHGDVICRTVYQALLQLDFNKEHEVEVFRLIVFDRQLPNWRPDRLLTISPLCEHMDFPKRLSIWKGATKELKDYQERLAKATASAARAVERKASGAAPRAKAPRRERRQTQQGAAAKAAAAANPEHQAMLAIQDLQCPILGDDDAQFWDDLFDEDDAEVRGQESDEDQLFADDVGLDATLASLKRQEPGDVTAPVDFDSDGSVKRMFENEVDSDDLLASEGEAPMMTVRKPREHSASAR